MSTNVASIVAWNTAAVDDDAQNNEADDRDNFN